MLVAVAALVATACGGDDGGADGGGADGAAPAATTTTAPVTSVRNAKVARNDDGTLTITWDGAGEVEVAWGTDPADVSTPLGPANGTITVADPKPGGRVYFDVGGVVTAERRLPLEGQPNFRDLGGYETVDGRRVKWGQLYRAGELGDLTDADLAYVESTGIKVVCDLRSDGEVELLADRLPPGVEAIRLPIADDRVDAAALRRQVLAGDLSGLSPDLLLDGNRAFVTDFTDEFGAMMERLMDAAARPALVHCTAGKDRAGFAAAVVLWTLGVPTETVMEDYLLTNEYRAAENEEALTAVEALTGDASALLPLLEARAEYLQAAIDTIEQEYGSIDAYVRDGLGITDDERRAFQDAMLE